MQLSDLQLNNSNIIFEATEVPWDSELLGIPVGQITQIEILANDVGNFTEKVFETWREENNFRLVACRIKHSSLRESMFLEKLGFRFIEMVFPMSINDIDSATYATDLVLEETNASDLIEIENIANSAFSTGRFNIDPQLDSKLGGVRYAGWVRNSFNDSKHSVIKACFEGSIVGFFITEKLDEQIVYWHLTAVSPRYQGQGFGRRIWQAMIMRHKYEGARKIKTMISARNTPVMNLYAQLGFRFDPPMMTFHWTAP